MSEMNSFQDAFYIMAKELGFDYAQPLSPREVFETQMLPRIKELIATHPAAGEVVAWQWRSRIKGGAWDAWENGRYDFEPAPFMDVEHRALYAAPPAAAHANGGEHELIGYMDPSALVGLLAGSDTTITISSATPSLTQPAPTPSENWAVPIYVMRRPGERP